MPRVFIENKSWFFRDVVIFFVSLNLFFLFSSMIPCCVYAQNAGLVELANTGRNRNHSWSKIFLNSNPAVPVFLVQIQSYQGADPAAIRMRNISSSEFSIKVEEEQSKDSEIGHAAEDVGYAVFEKGPIYNSAHAQIGESGILRQGQPDGKKWHNVNLKRTYQDPIVILNVTSYAGIQPVHARIKNVTPVNFQYQMEEWDYQDQSHTTEDLHYVVVERGVHYLDDGVIVEAGKITLNHVWKKIGFLGGYSEAPVIFGLSQTYAGNQAIVTRLADIMVKTFKIKIQEEEGNDGIHAGELVGYLVIGNTADPYCGDGNVDAGEECDGAALAHYICNEDCALTYIPYCGDGIVNQPSEQCDGTDGVGEHQECSQTCTLINLPYCGDGNIDEGEECDGSAPEHYTCESNCTLTYIPYCGDGNIDEGEECDGMAGVEPGQQCSSLCQTINRAPVLDPIGDKTVNENETLTFVISGSDPDEEDILIFSCSDAEHFDSQTQTFSWTPSSQDSGTYLVTFTVADNYEETDQETITITVVDIPIGTSVSGALSEDTVWVAANSPYILEGDVIVPSGITLTIDPGVVVKAANGFGIDVYGKILAQGKKEQPIVFTSNQDNPSAGNWRGIALKPSASSHGMLDYVHVYYAQMGIKQDNVSIPISRSIFEYNVSGIYLINNSSPVITENRITNNVSYGIHLVVDGANPHPFPMVNFNAIFNNTTYNFYTTYISTMRKCANLTINAQNNWWGAINPTTIAAGIYDLLDHGYRPKVNFDPFLDSDPFGNMIHDVSATNLFFDNLRFESTTINYALDEHAYVTLRLYTYPRRELIRILVDDQMRDSGYHSETWNGQDDQAQELTEGAYVYEITARTDEGNHWSYIPLFKPVHSTELLNFSILPSSGFFSPYKGERLEIHYDLEAPSLVTLKYSDSIIFVNKPRRTSANVDYWDGRDASGAIVTSNAPITIKAYVESLPKNFVAIEHRFSQDIIASVIADPYVIYPLNNEVMDISYTILDSTDVTVKIVSPDTAEDVVVLVAHATQNAGTYTVRWNGKTASGETVVESGDYRIRVEAVDSAGLKVAKETNIKIVGF